VRNILVVWFLTGMWHGAEWNFMLWGTMYGVLLLLEKLWLGKVLDRAPRAVGHIWVLLVTLFGFVIFNAAGLSGAGHDLAGMLGLGGHPLVSFDSVYYLKSYAVLILIGIVGAVPAPRKLALRFEESRAMAIIEPAACGILLLVSIASLISGSFNPFLYFRF